MKKALSVLAVAVMLLSPFSVVSASDNSELSTLAEQVMGLSSEDRAEFVAGMILYMTFSGEDKLLTDALNGMTTGFGGSPQAEANEKDEVDGAAVIAIGETSRKNPATVGQSVELEMNMYDEYLYTEIAKLSDVKFGDDAAAQFTVSSTRPEVPEGSELVACLFEISMGDQTDDGDREINIWNTDFKLIYPDGSEANSRATYADKYNMSLYSGGTGSVWVAFARISGQPINITFEPMNKYKVTDKSNEARSKAWFLVE